MVQSCRSVLQCSVRPAWSTHVKMEAAVQTSVIAINVFAHLDLQDIAVNTFWDTVHQNLVPMVAHVTHLGRNSGAVALHLSLENSAKLRAVQTGHVRTKVFAMNR